MGEHLTLTASDGHRLGAYRAAPQMPPRGGVVVLQEIFGVNLHIREVCDRFAEDGYLAIAPALYDRSSRKDVELGYEKADVALGRELRGEFSWDDTMLDIDSAVRCARQAVDKVASVGYCWGGSMSFLSAARIEISGAVVYYGGQILPYVEEQERCPLMMHFGKEDTSIPPDMIDAIRATHATATIHTYDAGHGFNCDRRAAYHEASAKLAGERTLDFFAQCLA